MRVIKRSGKQENVSFDKVLNRIKLLSEGLKVDYYDISQKVCSRIYDLIDTSNLDEYSAQICSTLILNNPDYGVLATRIIISNIHKNTSPSFSETIWMLYNNFDGDENNPLISDELYNIVMKNKEKLNSYIDCKKDYNLDYFGFKTLERSYLLKINEKIVERPQYMYMRVALGIHGNDFKDALETYDKMSNKYFIHATPTLFNAGTPRPQLSSCFLIQMEDDSIEGIFSTLKDCANISKYAGGIGLNIHNIRSKGAKIRGTNGYSSGIIPMIRVFNNTARYVDQAGRRPGSIAMYIEPWHADIESFLDLKKNNGKDEDRARDLFYAIWTNDLFMERVKNNEKWKLMNPDVSRGLSDVWGEQFNVLYTKYENEGKYVKEVNAQDIWFKILENQIETGTPYLLFKDTANRTSNQQNLGTIKSSNLCTEIIQYTSEDEVAVCNLSSICLPTFIKYDDEKPYYDFDELHKISQIITKNLNKIIDINFYPIEKARISNLRHRPIGIGVQGLADTFAIMRYSFDSDEAAQLNKDIFETIYHGALTSSMNIAKKRHEIIKNISKAYKYDLHMNEFEYTDGRYPGAYSSYEGSPASKGMLQFDLWNVTPGNKWDWESLKAEIHKWGIRNSLLLAPMPTASTSQICGFNESIEPFTSNIYKRKTLSGEFVLVNKYLIKDLIKLNLWDNDMKNKIIINDGSIANIDIIPADIRNLYKTVWDLKMRTLIDMSADRGAYICQSQSFNLWMEEPNFKKLSSMYFYGHSKGLITTLYYLRSKAKAKSQKFTIDPELEKMANLKERKNNNVIECNDEICMVCSS